MQETLLRAWKSFASLSDEAAVRSWLITIARREYARTFERKRLSLVDIDAALEADRASFAVEDDHDIREMRRAILELDEIYREPLVLQVMLGYSTDEIARHLGISLPAVLTRLHRARYALRKHMLGNAAEEDASA
jgi:RNA polymerase sigma factor, sigma-70 family